MKILSKAPKGPCPGELLELSTLGFDVGPGFEVAGVGVQGLGFRI